MPKVSVIIPVYEVEEYIERCAVSLFEQTLDDIEYIFVDDCTPDKSMEILESIIEKYRHRLMAEKKNVRIERMPTNSGQAAVRRHGMQVATGDYIIHCDSDDWVDTDMYRAMYENAIANNADIVVCDYCQTNGQTRTNYVTAFDPNLYKEDVIKVFLLEKYAWSVWNKLVKRNIYSNNDFIFPTGNMGEDLVITVQCFLYSKRISYIPMAYYYYYINENSITQDNTEKSCFSKFNQYKDNVAILLNLDYGALNLDEEFLHMKYHALCLLLPLIGSNRYYRLWRNQYKGISVEILTSSNVKPIDKLKYILALIHLYPLKKDRVLTSN